MKKISLSSSQVLRGVLFLVAFVTTMSAFAQMPTMRFVGNADYVVGGTKAVSNETDTVKFVLATGNITIPAVTYGQFNIPSFTITGATFAMGQNQVVTFTENQTFTVEGLASCTLKSGSYTMATNKFDLVVEYQKIGMPMVLTLTFSGYYVKSYTATQNATVGGTFGPYSTENVAYDVRKYTSDGTEYVDVAIPTTVVNIGTAGQFNIGNLTVGNYTVRKLVWDADKQAYYKDYSSDGLTMYVKTEGGTFTLNDTYDLTGNISLQYNGTSIYVCSNPKPGNMPLTLKIELGDNPTAIDNVAANVNANSNATTYKTMVGGKLVIVKNGKQYGISGAQLK